MELTHDQKAIHFETWEHIHQVRKILHEVQKELLDRALNHDQSKIHSEEECATFAEFTPKLKQLEYGSEAYSQCLKDMGPAVRHHQTSNRHHPESFDRGIDGMNLIDVLEMFCDWKAATLRTKDGDIIKSLEIQRKRFKISDQLMNILYNSIPLVEKC